MGGIGEALKGFIELFEFLLNAFIVLLIISLIACGTLFLLGVLKIGFYIVLYTFAGVGFLWTLSKVVRFFLWVRRKRR